MKECKQKLEAGEFNTHVITYTNCQEPLILEAFKKAGVQNDKSFQAISEVWLAVAYNSDKGEPLSPDEFAKRMREATRQDISEP